MSFVNNYIGLLGCLLLMVAAPLLAFRQPRFSRRMIAMVIVVMMIIAVTPVNGLAIVAYIRGVTADLSMTSIILLAYFIAAAYTGKPYISTADKRRMGFMVLVCAIVVYPFGLGISPWDSYAAGYGDPWLYGLLFAATFWLYIKQRLFIISIILTGIIAYLFSLLVSQNLWDYLIDPWLVMAVLVQRINNAFRLKLETPETDSSQS